MICSVEITEGPSRPWYQGRRHSGEVVTAWACRTRTSIVKLQKPANLPRVEATPQQSGAGSRQGAGKPDGVALMLGAFRAAEVTDKQTDAQQGTHA